MQPDRRFVVWTTVLKRPSFAMFVGEGGGGGVGGMRVLRVNEYSPVNIRAKGIEPPPLCVPTGGGGGRDGPREPLPPCAGSGGLGAGGAGGERRQGKDMAMNFNREPQTAGFGPCFGFPGFHFGTSVLSHGHIFMISLGENRLPPASCGSDFIFVH